MTAYYNEIDPFAAQWLRNLIAAGHIAAGDVDERSVEDVQPDDLAGYAQCHFFAGIGVWSHALRFAGWPDDRPVWTGSCPCQPFSAAGKRAGFDDARHLWPAWSRLIAECHPGVVFGEQVASNDGYAWLDAVQADLEGLGYACGPVVLPAAGFGAPHGRHRIYFVGEILDNTTIPRQSSAWSRKSAQSESRKRGLSLGRATSLLADAGRERGTGRRDVRDVERPAAGDEGAGGQRQRLWDAADDSRADGRLADHEARRWGEVDPLGGAAPGRVEGDRQSEFGGTGGSMADTDGGNPSTEREQRGREQRQQSEDRGVGGWWAGAEWLPCIDGKSRPVEPGTFPLAHGATARVGRLRAYGNAITAPVAAEFINAYMELVDDT